MPLPQKVTDRLAQAPSRTPGGLRQLLLLSTLIFLLSISSYVGLGFGYKKYLENSIQNSKDEIIKFSEQVPIEEQEKLINFYSQIINLKSLLDGRINLSPIFTWLQSNTQINTHFSNFSFDKKRGSISLLASSKSFDDMTEQILAFEILKDQVKDIKISNISSNANTWQFNLNLELSQNLLAQLGGAENTNEESSENQ